MFNGLPRHNLSRYRSRHRPAECLSRRPGPSRRSAMRFLRAAVVWLRLTLQVGDPPKAGRRRDPNVHVITGRPGRIVRTPAPAPPPPLVASSPSPGLPGRFFPDTFGCGQGSFVLCLPFFMFVCQTSKNAQQDNRWQNRGARGEDRSGSRQNSGMGGRDFVGWGPDRSF